MSESLIERAVRRVGPNAVYAAIPPGAHQRLRYEWRAWARPEQLPPEGDWYTWLILAGRGFGKTRCGAEWIREQAERGQDPFLLIAGPTAGDVRDVMVEGESGILSISPPWFRPLYEPSKLRLTWPNGVVGYLLSADEPDRFRGKQATKAWVDELAAWRYAEEAWNQVQICTRLPGHPQVLVSTTPRPTPTIKQLLLASMVAEGKRPDVVVTRGNTFENSSNLSAKNLDLLRRKYEGTRLGRQELYAEVLADTPGALWTADIINAARIQPDAMPKLMRTVVGVDPSGSSHRKSDELGIDPAGVEYRKSDEAGVVTVGLGICQCKGGERDLHLFVLRDNSGVMSPSGWARESARAFRETRATLVVGERNYGGDMVGCIIESEDPSVVYRDVIASKGKAVRAAPAAALYEQGRVHHVGHLPGLEDQLTTWDPITSKVSPGRLDALVWAIVGRPIDKQGNEEPSLLDMLETSSLGALARVQTEGSSRYSRRDGL